MNPMTIEEAENKKLLLSKAYFIISLITFSTVLYQIKQGRLNWLENEGLIPEEETKLSPAFQYARMLGVEKATVVRIKGTEILNSKDYAKESFDVFQHIQEEEDSVVDPEKKIFEVLNCFIQLIILVCKHVCKIV